MSKTFSSGPCLPKYTLRFNLGTNTRIATADTYTLGVWNLSITGITQKDNFISCHTPQRMMKSTLTRKDRGHGSIVYHLSNRLSTSPST